MLPIITITGADERTDVTALGKMQAEIGLLYTATPEGRNRYPRKDWIKEAAKSLPRVAIHVCGRVARQQLVDRKLDDVLASVQRVQVNGRLSPQELSTICAQFKLHTVITQHNDANKALLRLDIRNHSLLLDSSGGRGQSPDSWIRPGTRKPFGFAGGLGPENLLQELPNITAVAADEWWIDMEGKLRIDDWFSIEQAQFVVDLFREFLAQNHENRTDLASLKVEDAQPRLSFPHERSFPL